MENDVDMNETHEWQELPSISDDSPPPLNVNQEIPIPALPAIPSRFRMNSINIFCTWPQCDEDKGTVLARIMAWHNVEWAVVAKEDHKETDGVHLHAVVHLSKKCNVRTTTVFDAWAGKHGDYKSCRDLKNSVNYVIKDGDYVSNGIDLEKFLEEKKSAKSSLVAEMVKTDIPLAEIMEKESGFWLLHSKQIKEFKAEWSQVQLTKTLTGFQLVQMRSNLKSWEKEIGIWLNTNLTQVVRPLGSLQLFLYGKTAVGKTHMCMELAKMVKTFWATSCEHFFDRLDDTYDLIVMDEFHGQQTITFMNQFIDGQPMVLPQKGCQYHKVRNVPIIILSNYAPKDCYRHVYDDNREHFDAFQRRLKIVQAEGRIDLWKPQERPPLLRQNSFVL